MRLVFTIETGAAELGEPRTVLGRLAQRQGRLEGVRGDDEVPEAPPAPAASAPPIAPERLEAAWQKLVEAQQRLVTDIGKDPRKDADRAMWVGGAMAIYAACSGETEKEVGRRLGEEVPTETWHGIPVQPQRDIDRPPPHEGAQRIVGDDDEPLEPDPGLERWVTPPGDPVNDG